MTVKTIVFDFGGVLVDWNPRYFFRNVFSDENEMEYFLTQVCSPEWNASLDKGKPFKQAVAELSEKFPQYAEQIRMYDSHWEDMCASAVQGSVDLLRRLAKRYPVYGLTNWSDEKFKIALKKYDFFSVFKGIVVSGVEKEIKPEPRLFEILIERYGLNPAETVFTDDSLPNIKTAESLGFQTIHFQSPAALEAELKRKGVVTEE